jgi:hypothetical protein
MTGKWKMIQGVSKLLPKNVTQHFPISTSTRIVIKRFFVCVCMILQRFKFLFYNLLNFDIANKKKNIQKKNTKTDFLKIRNSLFSIQGVFEMRAEILTTSYWVHVELGKNI